MKTIPASVIEHSAEYKLLQTTYSVILQDNIKMKQSVDEINNILTMTRAAYIAQLEQMESEELRKQKEFGSECMQLEQQVINCKKENEHFRVEFEKAMAENKQASEISKEMRSLITTLQTSNKLLKSDNTRLKKRVQECQEEIERHKSDANKQASNVENGEQAPATATATGAAPVDDKLVEKLNAILAHEDLNESRDKLKELLDNIKAFSEKLNDKQKRFKALDDSIRDLQRSLNAKKVEETALLNDMEITGQAFEDMQEQNVRLMQQLREKDDANFKLITERIKLESIQRTLKEEKDVLVEQINTMNEQHEAQVNVLHKLEEEVKVLNGNIFLLEKELSITQKTCDESKKNAIANAHTITELKLHTQRNSEQIKETQNEISAKAEALLAQSYQNKRLQEQIKHLELKLERNKKFESASSIDEVLKVENREFKEQLLCPSCKVKQKDAVLTKCFHVFCYDCLQKRYELRQRKCPKCNANFGANDFRRLYLC